MIKKILRMYGYEKVKEKERLFGDDQKLIVECLRYIRHRITRHPGKGASRVISLSRLERIIETLQ